MRSGDLLKTTTPWLTRRRSAFKDTFLTELMSVDIRSKEFPNTLAKVLASQEGMDAAVSLQGDDALALVDVLDQVGRPSTYNCSSPIDRPAQVFHAPGIELDLRRKSISILRRVCGTQNILPRSCILSDDISKDAGIPFALGELGLVWRGHRSGNQVCIKVFHHFTPEDLFKIKQVRSKCSTRGAHLMIL